MRYSVPSAIPEAVAQKPVNHRGKLGGERYNHAMKLPRWLVIAMLTTSVLFVLAAAGWLWVTWPERTAREFTVLLAEGRVQQANQMMRQPVGGSVPLDLSEEQWQLSLRQSPLQLQPRTAADLLKGRQDFKEVNVVMSAGGLNVHGKSYQFTAQRGMISVRQTGDWVKMPSGVRTY